MLNSQMDQIRRTPVTEGANRDQELLGGRADSRKNRKSAWTARPRSELFRTRNGRGRAVPAPFLNRPRWPLGEPFFLKPRFVWVMFGFARAHGLWTYEPRQGRKAATVVCSASAVVTLAFEFAIRDFG